MFQKITPALVLSLALAAPLAAQEWQMPRADEEPPGGSEDGGGGDTGSGTGTDPLDDLGQELDGAMGLLFQRLQPHLDALGDELGGAMGEFSPALGEIGNLIDDMGNYERPERLPNGDIVIRRRSDAPPPPPMNELQRLLPPRGDDRPETPDPWRDPDGDERLPLPQTEL